MAALSSPVLRPPHAAESVEKIIYLVCLTVCIELVFFKFLPDIATAVIQGGTSNLSVFTIFEQTYLRPGSVHHARFLGNDILYYLARHVAAIGISQDIRLYPLRIAAGILTPLSAQSPSYAVVPRTIGEPSLSRTPCPSSWDCTCFTRAICLAWPF
jgi:hypothetical protein